MKKTIPKVKQAKPKDNIKEYAAELLREIRELKALTITHVEQ